MCSPIARQIGNVYYLRRRVNPGDTSRSSGRSRLVEIDGILAGRRMTLSAFILLPTFMCISRHDRRDNRARCGFIVNVSQLLLLCVYRARYIVGRALLRNRARAPPSLAEPPSLINSSTRPFVYEFIRASIHETGPLEVLRYSGRSGGLRIRGCALFGRFTAESVVLSSTYNERSR